MALFRIHTLRLIGALPALPLTLHAAPSMIDTTKLPPIRETLTAAVAARTIPGGVLWMQRGGSFKCEAYGNRMVDPDKKPMLADTVFDAASLTKVACTAPCIMVLVEQGKVKLDEPVSTYLKEFTGPQKEHVTVRKLLTHTSGTRSGIPRGEEWTGYDEGIRRAAAEPLINVPGLKFVYSDINFILLGEIVRRVSGEPLDRFAASRLFKPLGMVDTGFKPSSKKRARIAPTTREPAGLVHGVVHDPTSRRMGGVAGHAGLFTTARDLAVYCRCLLAGGRSAGGKQILTMETVRLMTAPIELPNGVRRSLGFDVQSFYSDPKGERFGALSFGHTGWTGTALWIDPQANAFFVLLTNRNHPDEHASVKELRWKVSTLVAEAMGIGAKKPARRATRVTRAPRRLCAVRNGIDVLAGQQFAPLKGLRVGLITNHTGRDAAGNSTIDLLAAAPETKLVCLFSPEHGIRGTEDRQGITDSRDEKTGLPVFSLYDQSRRPVKNELALLDALVFDIQDIGCRFYTYISTMLECMSAAAEHKKKFFVLDRVNPIGGELVDGPMLAGAVSFTACHPLPVRHGMTVGELAQLFAAEKCRGLDLAVIKVTGWKRRQDFAATGLPWVNPSPNMRSLDAATLYPGIGLLEFCNLSVGRGTDTPFLLCGAPWVDGEKLARALQNEKFSGVRIEAAEFTPVASVFRGERCRGVRFVVTDRARVPSLQLGVALARALLQEHGKTFDIGKMQRLLCHPPTLNAIREGRSTAGIEALWRDGLDEFKRRRVAVLLY